MALALMPLEQILGGLDDIRNAALHLPGSSMVQLLKYFESNWMFNIELRNVSGFNSRTNNTCEDNEYNLLNKCTIFLF
jgi:hypothetical protein